MLYTYCLFAAAALFILIFYVTQKGETDPMAFVELNYGSYNLGMDSSVSVFLPEKRLQKPVSQPDRKYPVLYLLHGHSDDHTAYVRKGITEILVRDLDLIVVMPNGHRSFYTNAKQGHLYENFITQELPVVIENYFPASSSREDRFIAGLSMGGYGALKLALNHPDLYAAAASMSGAVSPRMTENEKTKGMFAVPDMFQNLENIFGSEEDYKNSGSDLMYMARKVDESEGPKPRIFQCCGTEDPLIDDNRALRDVFQNELKNIPYEYKESPGIHNWFYWNQALVDILEFLGFAVDRNVVL